MHAEKKFNPSATFNSLMVYNFIITILVFVVGGFSGCYKGSIDNVYDFRDVMSTVVMSGVRWSAVTFLLGMIISFIASAFTIVEKMNEKQNLSKRIERLRNQYDIESLVLKKESERKISGIAETFKEMIDSHKKTVDSLKEEKDRNYKQLQEEEKKKTEEIITKIKEAFGPESEEG